MRVTVLLSVVSVFAVVLLGENYLPSQSLSGEPRMAAPSQQRPDVWSDGERMWSRAQIRVVPLDVARANREEMQSLRDRVAQAEGETLKLSSHNPQVREHLYRQDDLIRALLNYAERQNSDQGKSLAALDVQRHLNEIEGRTNCGACHTRVIATRKPAPAEKLQSLH